jgi:hypothetical protein
MAVTAVTTVDVAKVLATLLADVDGLRVHWYMADTVRPPAVVIGQPEIDYADTDSGFCAATWLFPLTVVVARGNDRDAQRATATYLAGIVAALAVDVVGVHSIEPQTARPIPVTVSGQELPGYSLTVRVRA